MREWGPSVALGLLAAVLYGATLCPTVSWYDSAEFSASAATLRVVPHPPGYPLYTLIGHVFTWLPGEAAWGMNVMSLVFGVACVVLMHRVGRALGFGQPASVAAAVVLAVAPTLWDNAVKAEVYTPGLAWMLAVVLLCLRAQARDDVRWAWAAAGVAGVGLGVHMSLATWGLGFVTLLIVGFARGAGPDAPPRARAFWLRLGLGCTVAVLLGSLVFLLIPFGPFDTVTPLGPYPNTSERMWRRFTADVTGGVFRKYFKPMPADVRATRIAGIFVDNLGALPLALAVCGLGWTWVRRRGLLVALVLGAVGNVAFFFRYDVPDLDVFLLPAMVSVILLCAAGVEALHRTRRALGLVAVAAVIGASSWTAGQTYALVDRSNDRSARAFGEAACARLEPHAVLAMTSMPSEWHPYSVLLYMHESGEGCQGAEFWGLANPDMIRQALAAGRPVYAYVQRPRFAGHFTLEPDGPLYRVRAP
ncbi:MAG: DUF2723 domain-containing protein [Myxococcota bacterium]